jgi:hypothetical protein
MAVCHALQLQITSGRIAMRFSEHDYGKRMTKRERDITLALADLRVELQHNRLFSNLSDASQGKEQTRTQLLAILLYTDEDKELASYIRKHFRSLNQLTGEWSMIYVFERPPLDARSIIGVVRKPLGLLSQIAINPPVQDDAYEVARRLGIAVDQLPCLVILGKDYLSEKLVVPITRATPRYFRKLFAMLEEIILGALPNSSRFEAYSRLSVNFKTIRKNLNRIGRGEKKAVGTRYTFKGNTVFINRPKKRVRASDFQK